MKSPVIPPAVLTVLAAAALVGCGSGSSSNGIASQSPARALARARSAAESAATVHLSGSMGGPGRPISIDMALVSGKGATGSAVVGGLNAHLAQVAGWLYVKGNPALMRRLVGASAAAKLAGRWLKAPASHGPLAGLATLTDLRPLLGQTLSNDHRLSAEGVRRIDGQPALALADNVERATLYVSSLGIPYPLELVKRGGRISFDRWNQPVTLVAPPNAVNVKALRPLP